MTKKISKQTPKKVNKLSLADKRRLARLKKNIAPTAQNTLMYSELYEEGLMHVVDDIYSKTEAYALSCPVGVNENSIVSLKNEKSPIITSSTTA